MGQVTSARYSEQLGQVIGMAWVPAALAKDGARIVDLRRGQAHGGRGPDEALLRPRRGDPALMSSLAFLSPGPGALAKSPMEPGAAAAGATFEERDGWKVAVSFPDEERALSTVGFADMSHIWKMELQAGPRISRAMHRRRLAGTGPRDPGGARLVVPVLAHARRRRCAAPATPRRSATSSPRRPRTPTAWPA